MSYILDALKKAERDRRRARVPSLQTMHAAPPERRPMWPWIVGGALALNAIGFATLLVVRPTPSAIPPIAPSSPTSAPAVAAARSSDAGGATSHAAAVVDQPGTSATARTAARATSAGGATTENAQTEQDSSRRTATRSSVTRDDDMAARESSRPPVGRESARIEPDALKLEVLIYSENAAERVAYISGQRYIEGQRVGGRFVVERITRDGVILAVGGKRYLLKQQ